MAEPQSRAEYLGELLAKCTLSELEQIQQWAAARIARLRLDNPTGGAPIPVPDAGPSRGEVVATADSRPVTGNSMIADFHSRRSGNTWIDKQNEG